MRPTVVSLANATRHAAKEALRARLVSSTYPVIQKCPTPTCECADMPPDLDIEREKSLNGTMAAHDEQVLIPSGVSDWTSKIEDEKDTAPWGEFVSNLKEVLGKNGQYHDPYHNISINTCSFNVPSSDQSERLAQAIMFPSFKIVDQISTEKKSVTDFVKTFLLPMKLHNQHNSLSEEEKKNMTRDPEGANSPQWAGKVRPISAPAIMVCSHHTRDSRCGILGPLLHAEFTQYINKRHTLRNQGLPQDSLDDSVGTADAHAKTFASHPEFKADMLDQERDGMHPINVGMVSHIGGHKWAGNVVVYIPPDYCCNPVERVAGGAKPKDELSISEEKVVGEDERADEILNQEKSPLAGKTIWYGRVEPRHVEGIVEQTIGHGKIIGELFRGGVNADGSYLRI